MDGPFLTLASMLEDWWKKMTELPAHNLFLLLIQYGEAKGLLLRDDQELAASETDESVLLRALCAAAMARDVFGEDVGVMCGMTRAKHLEVIKKASSVQIVVEHIEGEDNTDSDEIFMNIPSGPPVKTYSH